jgi:hypothetical protein
MEREGMRVKNNGAAILLSRTGSLLFFCAVAGFVISLLYSSYFGFFNP